LEEDSEGGENDDDLEADADESVDVPAVWLSVTLVGSALFGATSFVILRLIPDYCILNPFENIDKPSELRILAVTFVLANPYLNPFLLKNQ